MCTSCCINLHRLIHDPGFFFWRQIRKIRFMKKCRTPQEIVWICQSSRQRKKPVAGVNMQVSLQFA